MPDSAIIDQQGSLQRLFICFSVRLLSRVVMFTMPRCMRRLGSTLCVIASYIRVMHSKFGPATQLMNASDNAGAYKALQGSVCAYGHRYRPLRGQTGATV